MFIFNMVYNNSACSEILILKENRQYHWYPIGGGKNDDHIWNRVWNEVKAKEMNEKEA